MPIITNLEKYESAALDPRASGLLAARTVEQGECRIWIGPVTPGGYGLISLAHRSLYVHRLAYWIARGPIPDGLTIDHLCKNTRCVNTNHLEVVTAEMNAARSGSIQANNARKTHCQRGHAFDAENTSIRTDAKGRQSRQCKLCKREAARQQRIRNNKKTC